MEFLSNNFKTFWWALLVCAIGYFLFDRYPEYQKAEAHWFDAMVLIIWIALCLAPFFSEMELLGFKFKKQIEEVKEHVSQEVADIRNDLRISNENSQTMSPNFLLGYPPPPDSQLDSIELKVKEAVETAMRGHTPKNSDLHQFYNNPSTTDLDLLFRARYTIEKSLREINRSISEDDKRRPVPIRRLVEKMIKYELISPEIGRAITEVYSVCSPAIHGEEVTAAQVEFVRNTAPDLIAALEAVSERYA